MRRAAITLSCLVPLYGACDDDTSGLAVADLAAPAGFDLAANVNPDQAVSVAANAQVALLDVGGEVFTAVPDGGVVVPGETHVLRAVANFPSQANAAQHADPDPLHGCTWNRFGGGALPVADENAGVVTIGGFDTSTVMVDPTGVRVGTLPGGGLHPDATIACSFNSDPATPFYGCTFPVLGDAVGRFVFPQLPNPSPSPSPAPATLPQDLLPALNPDGSQRMVTMTLAHRNGSTYSDLSGTIGVLPAALHITSVNGSASKHRLGDLSGQLDGKHDLEIHWSCDGSDTDLSGCPTNMTDLVALLVETAQSPPWEAPLRTRWGTAQCLDESGTSASRSLTLTKDKVAVLLGCDATGANCSDSDQWVRVTLVHVKAAPAASGPHVVFLTAGHGAFAFIKQTQ